MHLIPISGESLGMVYRFCQAHDRGSVHQWLSRGSSLAASSLDWFCWENFHRKPMGFYHEIVGFFPVPIFPSSNSMKSPVIYNEEPHEFPGDCPIILGKFHHELTTSEAWKS